MDAQNLEAEKWRIRRAVVEEMKPLSYQDAARVYAFARRLRKRTKKRTK